METMTVSLRGFANRIDNAIVDNVVSTTPSQSRSANAGQASSTGFEAAVEHSLTGSFGWFANATMVSSSVEDPSNQDQDGTDIPFVPDTVVNAGLSIKLPWETSIFPYLHRVGTYYDSTSKSSRQEFGPYTVLNCRLQKTLMKSKEYAMELAIDLNNITDERYKMPWQFRDPGFNSFASLEVRF
jgi:outer membrane receptor protein involved in Fe transport